MSTAAVYLLVGAALLGSWLIVIAVQRRQSAARLGLTHAALALSGTALLFIAILTEPTSKLNNIAALFLVLALLGGGLVFALREQNKPPSMLMVAAHAIFGLIAISILSVKLF